MHQQIISGQLWAYRGSFALMDVVRGEGWGLMNRIPTDRLLIGNGLHTCRVLFSPVLYRFSAQRLLPRSTSAFYSCGGLDAPCPRTPGTGPSQTCLQRTSVHQERLRKSGLQSTGVCRWTWSGSPFLVRLERGTVMKIQHKSQVRPSQPQEGPPVFSCSCSRPRPI